MKTKKEIHAPSYLGFPDEYKGFVINNLNEIEDVFLVTVSNYIDDGGGLLRKENEVTPLHFFADEKISPKDFLKPRKNSLKIHTPTTKRQ